MSLKRFVRASLSGAVVFLSRLQARQLILQRSSSEAKSAILASATPTL